MQLSSHPPICCLKFGIARWRGINVLLGEYVREIIFSVILVLIISVQNTFPGSHQTFLEQVGIIMTTGEVPVLQPSDPSRDTSILESQAKNIPPASSTSQESSGAGDGTPNTSTAAATNSPGEPLSGLQEPQGGESDEESKVEPDGKSNEGSKAGQEVESSEEFKEEEAEKPNEKSKKEQDVTSNEAQIPDSSDPKLLPDGERTPWEPTEAEFEQYFHKFLESRPGVLDTDEEEAVIDAMGRWERRMPLRWRIAKSQRLSLLSHSYFRLIDDR
jgi:hypothetical protein